MTRYCFDLDGTVCFTRRQGEKYEDVLPIPGIRELFIEIKNRGGYIIVNTARNMETHSGNVGKITALQVPIIMDWFKRRDIPIDELYIGKPLADVYVDDKGLKFTSVEQLKKDLGLNG